jgi:hypothetical protein
LEAREKSESAIASFQALECEECPAVVLGVELFVSFNVSKKSALQWCLGVELFVSFNVSKMVECLASSSL